MYNFRDITEVSEEVLLPSEAMMINGEYIENLIEGYRTLTVTGREALSPAIETFETGVRDGSSLLSRKYPERTIVVQYQLKTSSNEEFRDAYNTLASILNVQDAELIFNDETDKFFIGTPSAIGEVEAGRNSVIGEFEILCVDPFKYSVVEYESEQMLDDGSILIDYNGTYKSFPTLVAEFYNEKDVDDDGETAGTLTGNGDCGYVAFFNEEEKIIQLGNPEEQDGTNAYARSQTLVNQTFQTSTAWGNTAKALWSANNGKTLPAITQNGSVAMGVASYTVPDKPTNTSGTLINVTSSASVPKIVYKVTAKTSNRTASSVKVDIAITASLATSSNYFGRGYGLKASVYIGGAWRSVTLKKTTDYWRGKTGHTKSITVTVSGLSNTQTSLTGIQFKVERTDSLGDAGKLPAKACSNLKISDYELAQPDTYYLKASSYGSAAGAWHGASIAKTIPADAAGVVGAKDFTFTYKQKLSIGKASNAVNQLGGFQAHLTTASGGHVAGVRLYKNAAGKNGTLILYLNGVAAYSTAIDMSYNNKYFGNNSTSKGIKTVKTSSIIKSGNKVEFNIGGFKKTLINSAIANLLVAKITIAFEQYSTATPLEYNGLYNVKFIKNNCETWKDIPNKFSANDVIEADCKEGKIYLNGVERPDYGALGNDWEGMYLKQGLNQIGTSYSEWVESAAAPTMKVRYREVYL